MKKSLILQLLLLFTITINGYCQEDVDFLFRHSQGSKGLLVKVGALTKGYYGGLGYSYFFKKYYCLDGVIAYEEGRYNLTDFTGFRLSGNNNFSFYSFKKTLFFNANVGGFIGQESIKAVLFENSNTKEYLTYGLFLGTNVDYYLTNRISLGIAVNQNIVHKSLIRDSFVSLELCFRLFM